MGEGIPHGDQEPVGVERLLQKIEGAPLGGFNGGGDGPVSGDHHHLRLGVQVSEPGQRLQTVEPRHLHVEEDQMRPVLGIERDRLATRGGHPHDEILVLEDLLQGLPDP